MEERLRSIPDRSRYSAEASAVLDRAQAIAKQSGKLRVTTGCLLLSIAETPESVRETLSLMGGPEQIAAECRKVLRIDQNRLSTQQSTGLDLPFSPDAVKTLKVPKESGESSEITVAQILRGVTLQGRTMTDANMILKRVSLLCQLR